MKAPKPFATVLDAGTSYTNKTGSWRTERPVYTDKLPPCNKACPAGENIQEWLALTEEGKYEEAWREIVKNNPFPAIMGRVCYHPCETACNRVIVDDVVGINSVERFLGDLALKEKWKFKGKAKNSGKKVLIIGAGPAGLSAAYQLAMSGHKVTLLEMHKKAGGMMRYGIPSYRLPRKVLDAEITRILDLGVKLETKAHIDDVADTINSKKYDAVFLSIGAHIARMTEFEVKDRARVLDAVSVLADMETTKKPRLGKRVAVYGGGNTAIDVARTALRLGAKEVTVVYRRTRERMPAHDFEVEEAMEEGVKFKFLVTVKSYAGKKLSLQAMELDKSGFPQPKGRASSIEVDSIVLALGQDSDLGPIEDIEGLEFERGCLKVDTFMQTGAKGIFAGGDMIPEDRTVTTAIGHGKKAAKNIDLFLKGKKPTETIKHADATKKSLNKWYYSKSPRMERTMMDPAERAKSFAEVQKGLGEAEALQEARRCLSCGNCFECDNCYSVCPDNAIKKLGTGKGFQIDYDYCKGCGLCVAECPCGCIVMQPEDI